MVAEQGMPTSPRPRFVAVTFASPDRFTVAVRPVPVFSFGEASCKPCRTHQTRDVASEGLLCHPG